MKVPKRGISQRRLIRKWRCHRNGMFHISELSVASDESSDVIRGRSEVGLLHLACRIVGPPIIYNRVHLVYIILMADLPRLQCHACCVVVATVYLNPHPPNIAKRLRRLSERRVNATIPAPRDSPTMCVELALTSSFADWRTSIIHVISFSKVPPNEEAI